ncbi:hypothetical protein RIVM261_026480 [Rivularia sp. IAM M-261]|nr:hypothetical protein CAL7716_014550 [Calothrix sp. PCC 7716]GJD17692.1 hypothetical protein RIVM261_026480 [Rivularia sp. IAM M-261]
MKTVTKIFQNCGLGIVLLGASLLSNYTLVAVAQDKAVPSQQQVEEVAQRLEGIMDTSARARVNPKAANVRMTACRISLNENAQATNKSNNPIFLYQEQALSSELNKPYRQRFLEISSVNNGRTVRSLSYKPANVQSVINLCNKPVSERVVTSTDLGKPVCSVYLTRSGENYIGVTPNEGCPANFRGAVKITNTVVLSKTGMNTWDRGFDANGKQVWGAKGESYEFRKITQ